MSQTDFDLFIQAFQERLREIIDELPAVETENRLEGLQKEHLQQIMSLVPLKVFIPAAYGGLGDRPIQCLNLLEAAAYESIAVALMIGINGSLFLEPLGKYGQPEARDRVFKAFLTEKALGGLMITEPDYGTDALSMQTCYTPSPGGYSIRGTKHWGGLTGLADFWLVTARREKEKGHLARDIDLFVCEMGQPGQRIVVEQYYHKLGLFLIPYGLNKIDIAVPSTARLTPHSSGVKLMMDLLHRSRLRLSGIGMGFIRRMLDEALSHCTQRFVRGKNLLSYDQVQHRLSQLQAWYTINSAMCHYSSRVSDVKTDLTSFALQANSCKAVLTDMMQDAAQSLLQLVGAKGYRRDHIAGRAIMDSRPFQIFEGSNDVMYSQIADAVLKDMKKKKESNLARYLVDCDLTQVVSSYYKKMLDLKLDTDLNQRSRVILGKILARLITTEFTVGLAEAGFRSDLVDNAIQVVGNHIRELSSNLLHLQSVPVISDYGDNGDWKQFASGPARSKTFG